MLTAPQLTELESRLSKLDIPDNYSQPVLYAIDHVSEYDADLGMLLRGSLERTMRNLEGSRRRVTKRPYLMHVMRVAAAYVDLHLSAEGFSLEPEKQDDYQQFTVGLMTALEHDNIEEPMARRVRESKDAIADDAKNRWRSVGLNEVVAETLDFATDYQPKEEKHNENLRTVIRSFGFNLHKLTRESPAERETGKKGHSWFLYMENMDQSTYFPIESDFPTVADLFTDDASTDLSSPDESTSESLTIKVLDVGDVVFHDLYPVRSDVQADYDETLAEFTRTSRRVSSPATVEDLEEYRAATYAAAERATDFFTDEFLEEKLYELRELSTSSPKEFRKNTKEINAAHLRASADLETWGSQLMHGAHRVKNLGKALMVLNKGYEHLDTLTVKDFRYRSLVGALDYSSKLMHAALEREINHHLVFHAADASGKKNMISWEDAHEIISLPWGYMEEHPNNAFRFVTKETEADVDDEYASVHVFSKQLKDLLHDDEHMVKQMGRKDMQLLATSVMFAYVRKFRENHEQPKEKLFYIKAS